MMAVIRVLYVDDEPGLLDIGKRFLEKEGSFTVDTSTSAKQALEQLNTEQYDAIISDYQMPEMDGIQFLVEVRTRFGQVPFILFTGRGREEVVIQAINSGADFYLQKGGEPAAQFAELAHKVRQAASRKRADDALKRSEAQLIAIIQGSPIPKFVIDRDHHVIHWNKALEGYSGILEKEIVGTKQHWRAFYKAERPCLADLLLDGAVEQIPVLYAGKYAKSKLIDGAYEATDFFPHMGKAGTWLFFTASIMKDDDGGILGAIETLEDITETHLKTEELKDAYQTMQVAFDQAKLSEERYRNVVEDQTEFISRFYPDGTHVFVNEAYCRYFGKSREEILGTRFHPTIHPDDRKSVARLIASLTPDHPIGTIDQRIIMPDGSTRWQRWVDRAIFLSDGRLKEYQSVGRDITEHKRVEEELREREEQLHNFISNLPVGLYRNTIGPEGNFLMANPHIARMHGYETLEEFVSQPTADMYMNPNERIAISDQLIREGSIFGKEVRLKRKNGEIFWGRVSAVAVRNQKGEVRCFDGFIEDITKRKRVEDALEASVKGLNEASSRYKALIAASNTGAWENHSDSGFLWCSPEYFSMLGREINDFDLSGARNIEQTWIDLLHPEDRERASRHFEAYLSNPHGMYEQHFRMLHKDGHWVWIWSRGKTVLDASGKPTSITVGTHIDITERKRVEDALRIKDTVFESSIAANSIADNQGIISSVNPAFLLIWGYRKKEDAIGKSIASFFADEKDAVPVLEALDTFGRWVGEFTALRVDGSTFIAFGIATVLRDETGKQIGYQSTLLDITERRQVEELYQTVFENTGAAMILLEEDTTISRINDEMVNICGYSREEIEGRVKWPTLVAEEDLKKMLEYHYLRRTNPNSAPRNYEFRLIHKNGGLRDIALTASMIPGTKKSVISLRDITEFKKTGQALHQVNKKLNLLSGITRHDITNQLTMLRGYLAILEDSHLNPSQNEYFRKVTTAAERISAMIQFTKEYETIGVNDPAWQDCRTLVDTAAKEAPLGEVMVNNDLPAGMEVFADQLISRVFYNLMDNAVRHGGKITTVRFSAEERDGDHIVVCEDDGVGIPLDEKEKIFDRGFGKNTGLGLFLSREVLDITGITIKETGEPGVGARFEMTVPKGAWRSASGGI